LCGYLLHGGDTLIAVLLLAVLGAVWMIPTQVTYVERPPTQKVKKPKHADLAAEYQRGVLDGLTACQEMKTILVPRMEYGPYKGFFLCISTVHGYIPKLILEDDCLVFFEEPQTDNIRHDQPDFSLIS